MEVENPNLYDIFEEKKHTKDKLAKRFVVQAILLFNEEIIMGIILHFVGWFSGCYSTESQYVYAYMDQVSLKCRQE
jgi:hypothetical protein